MGRDEEEILSSCKQNSNKISWDNFQWEILPFPLNEEDSEDGGPVTDKLFYWLPRTALISSHSSTYRSLFLTASCPEQDTTTRAAPGNPLEVLPLPTGAQSPCDITLIPGYHHMQPCAHHKFLFTGCAKEPQCSLPHSFHPLRTTTRVTSKPAATGKRVSPWHSELITQSQRCDLGPEWKGPRCQG